MTTAAAYESHVLGVLGGMGPAAGAYFALRLALLTAATRDQDHLPVILRNDPRIPDRSSAALRRTQSPLDAMQRGLEFLQGSGCSAVAIPCNTAHLWFRDLQESTSVPLLHIVGAVLAQLRGRCPPSARVALLGTPATIVSDLYRRPLREAGYSIVELAADEVARWCVAPIVNVKQNRIADAAAALADCMSVLADRDVHAVVLACTELPVACSVLSTGDMPIVVVDSIDALALSSLRHFGVRAKGGGMV